MFMYICICRLYVCVHSQCSFTLQKSWNLYIALLLVSCCRFLILNYVPLNDKSDFVGGKEKEKYIIATDLLALYIQNFLDTSKTGYRWNMIEQKRLSYYWLYHLNSWRIFEVSYLLYNLYTYHFNHSPTLSRQVIPLSFGHHKNIQEFRDEDRFGCAERP